MQCPIDGRSLQKYATLIGHLSQNKTFVQSEAYIEENKTKGDYLALASEINNQSVRNKHRFGLTKRSQYWFLILVFGMILGMIVG